jgi:hypothetical protein
MRIMKTRASRTCSALSLVLDLSKPPRDIVDRGDDEDDDWDSEKYLIGRKGFEDEIAHLQQGWQLCMKRLAQA